MTASEIGVLALDIGGTKLAAGIANADGRVLRRADAPTLAAEGADRVLSRAISLARECYDAELAGDRRIDAIGVSTMGYTSAEEVALAPNVPGWERLRIPDALAAAFPGLPMTIGNDVRLATQAELTWGSLRGIQEAIYLNLGTGIAAGIVSGGRILTGAHGTAGEVGYSLFRGSMEPLMAADGSAPFEEWFGGAGAARRLAERGLPASVAAAVERRDEEPAARAFLEELWSGIAALAANLCITLDPEVLSLGGGYVRDDDGVLEAVREVVRQAVPCPPAVVRARFGADASLCGAAAAAWAAIGRVGVGAPSKDQNLHEAEDEV